MELPGISALQSPNLSAWSQKLEVAQSARADQELAQAAGAIKKAGAGEMSPKEIAHLKDVCKDFESIFLGYMLKTMKAGGPKSDFLGKSQAEGIFTEMRDDELAKGMAKAGGIGLGKLMEEQLLRSLGKAPQKTLKSLENS
jgi:flagellar protein FlgJ